MIRMKSARARVPLLAPMGRVYALRTATVFFEGEYNEDGVPGPYEPGFVVCYDGLATGTLSNCERVAAQSAAPDAGVDPPAGDASNDDAPVIDVLPAVDDLDGHAP